MTPAGWLVALIALGPIVVLLLTAYLDHRHDQIEDAKRRHSCRRRTDEEER